MHDIEQIPQLLARPTKSWRQYFLESLLAVGGALAITGVVYAFHLYPTIPNISIVYLLLILILASTRGRYAAVVAAVVAFLSFDFFLIPPLYTFVIARWEEWLALVVFLVTALLTSQLAATTRHSIEQARLREREARILYEVGRVLNRTDRLDEQLDTIALALVRVFSPWGVRECALLISDAYGTLSMQADAPIRVEQFTLTPSEWAAAREVMVQGNTRDILPDLSASAGRQTVLRLVPLKTATQMLGVLCLRIEQGVSWFASPQHMQEAQEQPTEQAIFFWTFVDEAVIKIEHARLRGEAASRKE
jgi:two-component system sensor histidine kinase KdpD